MKKTQILTVYEYNSKNNGLFKEPISPETSVRLNNIIEQINIKRVVLERISNKHNETIGVRAFQYVGVIYIDKTLSIEILPKMYRSDNELSIEKQSDSIDNLFFMLDYCGEASLTTDNLSQLKQTKGNFFETLIHIFASNLISCIQNSVHHEYIGVEENLSYLKGKLLMAEHLKLNHINQSNFFTKSDNFTADNQLNQIFKHVANMLLIATNNRQNQILLHKIISTFDEVSDRRVTIMDANNIHLSRLSIRFEQSLKLSKLFLLNQSLQLNAHNHESFTFLIDMNSLFEKFVTVALKKATRTYKGTSVTITSQKPIKPFVEYTSKSRDGLFILRPDICIIENKIIRSIIDTKYKILIDDNKLGVTQADLYQMFAYAKKYNTNNITLLYPKRVGDNIQWNDFHVDEMCVIKIRTFDLQRNLKSHKTDFENDIYKIAFE